MIQYIFSVITNVASDHEIKYSAHQTFLHPHPPKKKSSQAAVLAPHKTAYDYVTCSTV